MTFRDLLTAAKQGNREATDRLIEMYMPLITHYSFLDKEFDDDLHQEQLMRFLRCIQKFSEDFSK